MNLKSAHTAKIGKAFIKARILRSLTQEEIANLTLINIDYIKAIESGDYQNFPARMFAVQYFEKYAKFLDLDINFFDIYNAEVVDAAEKELEPQQSKRSFFNKNIIHIFLICIVFAISLIFIFQGNNTGEPRESEVKETLSKEDDLRTNIESSFENDIGVLHKEINNFFIQDKLDSIQLDVTVDSTEPEA